MVSIVLVRLLEHAYVGRPGQLLRIDGSDLQVGHVARRMVEQRIAAEGLLAFLSLLQFGTRRFL